MAIALFFLLSKSARYNGNREDKLFPACPIGQDSILQEFRLGVIYDSKNAKKKSYCNGHTTNHSACINDLHDAKCGTW